MSHNIDFMFTGYPDVWAFIKKYYSKHRSVPDVEIIVENFDDFEVIEVKGETEYYIDSLREEYQNRKLEEITGKLATNVGKIAPNRVLSGAIADLMKLQNASVQSNDLNIMDFEAAKAHYEAMRIKAAEMGGIPGIPTGIDFIDSAYTSGLAGGDLVIVLGWTGRGKSLASTLICCNAYRKGFKPLIISLEMSAEKVRDRAYTMLGQGLFKNSDLAVGDVNEDDFRSWSKNFQGEFLVINNDGIGEFSPAVAQSKIDQYKPSIVVIDYAQLASDNSNSGDMTARMRNMSREYKMLAVANDIPVILISSATPDSAASTKTPPIIEQVAWSKQLAYDADLAFAVHKHDGPDGVIEVACRKNRNGDLFSGYFQADINNGIYREFFTLEDMQEI